MRLLGNERVLPVALVQNTWDNKARFREKRWLPHVFSSTQISERRESAYNKRSTQIDHTA